MTFRQIKASRFRAILLVGFTFLSVDLFAQVDTSGFAAAVAEFEAGKYKQAKKLMLELEKRERFFAPPQYYLGMMSLAAADSVKAESYFKMSAARDKKYDAPLVILGQLAYERGEIEVAREWAEEALLRNNNSTQAYILLAFTDRNSFRYSDAQKNFYNAGRQDVTPIVQLGDIALREKNSKDAIYFHKIASDLKPAEPAIKVRLAQAHLLAGDSTTAENLLGSSYATTSTAHADFGLMFDAYFLLLLQRGKYELVARMAVQKAPEDFALASYYAALACFKIGNTDQLSTHSAKYFELKGQKAPKDPALWAEEELEK